MEPNIVMEPQEVILLDIMQQKTMCTLQQMEKLIKQTETPMEKGEMELIQYTRQEAVVVVDTEEEKEAVVTHLDRIQLRLATVAHLTYLAIQDAKSIAQSLSLIHRWKLET